MAAIPKISYRKLLTYLQLMRLDSNINSKSSNNTFLNIIEILFLFFSFSSFKI